MRTYFWNRAQQHDSESNRREVDYFLWSFPDKAVAEILECTTNSMLKSKPSSIPVSRGELFKLQGFLLALTRTHSKRRDLFSVCDGLFPAPKKTQKWEHRLFSTLLGMIETDAYYAWRHFHLDGANDFTEELAQQLLTNTIDNVGTETRRSVSLENTILDVHADEILAHDIVLLTEHLKYARSKKTATGASKKALFRCHVCRNMATMYCKTCTMRIPHNTREMVIAVCSFTSAHKSRCINYHFMHGTSI